MTHDATTVCANVTTARLEHSKYRIEIRLLSDGASSCRECSYSIASLDGVMLKKERRD